MWVCRRPRVYPSLIPLGHEIPVFAPVLAVEGMAPAPAPTMDSAFPPRAVDRIRSKLRQRGRHRAKVRIGIVVARADSTLSPDLHRSWVLDEVDYQVRE